eukprot:TRINITY_DN3324_c0_g1_i1.p1 TRINITY_DN3324_c0_g1~~TRINITY_DN3324_c0_g1_i1.p1  ORF type:complete len:175 (-),score=57.81 TRINITY_DN3324_c0_g1_i1:143-637(-)
MSSSVELNQIDLSDAEQGRSNNKKKNKKNKNKDKKTVSIEAEGVEGQTAKLATFKKSNSFIDRVGSQIGKLTKGTNDNNDDDDGGDDDEEIEEIEDEEVMEVKEEQMAEATGEDWLNSGQIVFLPVTLLVLFSLFPLSFKDNMDLQNPYLFIFGCHFVYHLVAM